MRHQQSASMPSETCCYWGILSSNMGIRQDVNIFSQRNSLFYFPNSVLVNPLKVPMGPVEGLFLIFPWRLSGFLILNIE